MKPMLALLALATLAAGCTVSDSRRDDPGYIGGNQPYDPNVQPGYVQPGYVQPGYVQPGYVQPGYVQPGYGQPGYVQPPYQQGTVYVQPGTPYPQGGPPEQYDRGRDVPGRVVDRQPAPVPVNASLVRMGDNLVSSIDQYVQSIASLNSPDFSQMRNILGPMRSAADNFRTGARNGMPAATLRGAADDLLLRFQQANAIYGRLVATNRGYTSALFGKISDYTIQIAQTVKK